MVTVYQKIRKALVESSPGIKFVSYDGIACRLDRLLLKTFPNGGNRIQTAAEDFIMDNPAEPEMSSDIEPSLGILQDAEDGVLSAVSAAFQGFEGYGGLPKWVRAYEIAEEEAILFLWGESEDDVIQKVKKHLPRVEDRNHKNIQE